MPRCKGFYYTWRIAVLGLLIPAAVNAGTLEKTINTQVSTDVAAQQSQEHIDKLSDDTSQMLSEYREILKQTQSLQAYNDQLEKLVNSQKTEMQSIDAQLQNIQTTQRDIVPLMSKMIEVIAEFVDLDTPFLPKERHQRVTELQALMARADVSLAEKYRRIMEAYQVETQYGRTIEAYQGNLTENNDTRTVDFLRIGRVSLYYLTLDGKEAGMWDQTTKKWQVLPHSDIQEIAQAIKVARKQLPPDLLVLPVKTAEAIK